MHHYKKTVENFEDEDEENSNNVEREFTFWEWLLIGVVIIIIIIFTVKGGRKLYNSIKKDNIEVYNKLKNPRSRDDCFELKSGINTPNYHCLHTWEMENMSADELMKEYGAVGEIQSNYKNF